MKFFLLGYAMSAVIAGAVLSSLKSRFAVMAASVLVLAASASGILSTIYASQVTWELATNNEIQVARTIQRLTPADGVFLTSSIHNHLVPMIAGRAVLNGYPGWLWTHGINYVPTLMDIKSIYSGTENAEELLQQYDVDFVFIGPYEKKEFTVNSDFWEQNFESIYSDELYTIYKVN